MEIQIVRDVRDEGFTLGTMTVDGKDFGFTCEDTDRGLDQTMPLDEIKRLKVKGRTAIPAGRYRVGRDWSPKYGRDMLHVLNVPGYAGIRIHSGNDADDTEGCILPGLQRDVTGGRVLKSCLACDWLDREIQRELSVGRDVWLTITRG